MIEPTIKRALLAMLKRGQISIPEAAELGSVSRQAVLKWTTKRGWNMEQRRRAYVARSFRAMLVTDRRASKSELRQEAERAVREHAWMPDDEA